MLYIGCNLSCSIGYEAMGIQALAIDANTFAFFTRNPHGSSAKKFDKADGDNLRKLLVKYKFGKLVAHAPYTINACAINPKLRRFARAIMTDDLIRMEAIPGNYYNFHPGSHVKQGIKVGIKLISKHLNEVLKPDQSTTVLLETMAGKGSEIGRNFEELHQIIDQTELSDKLGVCFDTCHVWSSGYDIVGDLNRILEKFDYIIGLDYLKAVHINGSLNQIGTNKDRHARIGEGHINADALIRVINHPLLKKLPFILETPNNIDGYAREIKFLREHFSK